MKPRVSPFTGPFLAPVLLLILLLLPGCLSVNWVRQHKEEPPPSAVVQTLRAGRSTLDQCLRLLGAPLLVQRGPGRSTELLWASTDQGGWGFSISFNIFRFANPSFSYQGSDGAAEALRLRFDSKWRLVEKSRGSLASLRRVK